MEYNDFEEEYAEHYLEEDGSAKDENKDIKCLLSPKAKITQKVFVGKDAHEIEFSK